MKGQMKVLKSLIVMTLIITMFYGFTKSVYAEDEEDYIMIGDKYILKNNKLTDETVDGVSYDVDTGILTLNNCVLNDNILGDKSLKINILGENVINGYIGSDEDTEFIGNGNLSLENGDLRGMNFTLNGDCNINFLNSNESVMRYDGTITINSGTININSKFENVKHSAVITCWYFKINGGNLNITMSTQLEGWTRAILAMKDFKMNGGKLNINMSAGSDKTQLMGIDSWGSMSFNNADVYIKVEGDHSSCIEPGSAKVEGDKNLKLDIINSNCVFYAPTGHTINDGWSATVNIDDNLKCYKGMNKAEYRIDNKEAYIYGYFYPAELGNYIEISTEDKNLSKAGIITCDDDIENGSFYIKSEDGLYISAANKVIHGYNDDTEVNQYVAAGKKLTVVDIEDDDYVVDEIYINGKAIQNNTFEMPKEDVTVTVTYKEIETDKEDTTDNNQEDTTDKNQEVTTDNKTEDATEKSTENKSTENNSIDNNIQAGDNQSTYNQKPDGDNNSKVDSTTSGNKNNTESVKTGDNNDIFVMISLCIATCAIVMTCVAKKRRTN